MPAGAASRGNDFVELEPHAAAMPSLIVFIAPLALAAASPHASAPRDEQASTATVEESATLLEWTYSAAAPMPLAPEGRTVWGRIAEAFRAPSAEQVRIEQRLVVRIAPRSLSRELLADLPAAPLASRFKERKVGKCLSVKGIAGVQIGADDRLLLFMRDQRVIGASLEKACAARDFYSGFYVDRGGDGKLCVDRDMLYSRSGSACTVSRLRELVAIEK